MSSARAKSRPRSPASRSSRATAGPAESAAPARARGRTGGANPFHAAPPAFGLAAPVQAKCASCEAEEATAPVQLWDCGEYTEPTCVQKQDTGSKPDEPVQTKCAACAAEEPVQTAGAPSRSPQVIQSAARHGLQGASQPLPHGGPIQSAFGRHDVSHVRTNTGGDAAVANRRMGALAFTSGDRIGFRAAPSLRLAAHEAAHVVQQREGLSLPGNVGRPGDRWERHADRVADAVVAGRSAEPLLDEVAPPGAPAREPAEREGAVQGEAEPQVQQQITSRASRLFEPPAAPAEAPAAPAPGAGGKAEGDTGAAADEGAAGAEGPAIEEAEEGGGEAPPEGVTTGGGGAGGGASGAMGAAPAAPAGGAGGAAPAPGTATPAEGGQTPAQTPPEKKKAAGPVSGSCYHADSPAPPENAPEPSSDNQGADPKAEPQVTFEPWPAAVDECPAEAAVAQADQQMPEGVATATATAEPATAPSAPGAPGIETAEPMAAAAPAGAEGAAAPAEAPAAEGGGMDGSIASAEGERDTAVADYLTSMDGLAGVSARSRGLERGVVLPNIGPAEEREAATVVIQAFLGRAADQISAAVAFAREEVPGRLGGLAEATKANIQGAMETEKGAISSRIAQARVLARAGAAAARAHVHAEYANSAAQIEASTLAAITALDTHHQTSVGLVDEKETTGLGDVDSRFAAGRTQHEAKGPEYATLAIEKGQAYAHAYEPCKGDYGDDGFWDGCLTVRRAKAQQDAACKTAAGYKDVFLRTANKKAYDLKELRKQYRCAVIAGARQVNQTLDDTHGKLVSGLESGRTQALASAALARDANLAAIGKALAATLQALAAQEASQRQAVNDTGYLKQLAVEQLAHSSAANLARGVSTAMESLEQTLATLRRRFARSGVPDLESLAAFLATAEAGLGGGMGTLLETMAAGAGQAETRIADLGAATLDALLLLTTTNDETTAQGESGFAQQMAGLRSGATRAFKQITANHVQQAQDATAQGTSSMDQAVAGFDQALATIGGKVDEAIGKSLQELDQDLGNKLAELDGQIASEAWKAAEKEQPAWKSVVAILLVIVVIIAAAVISIVTLGAGASLFAVILVGALVGAVSGGLIQIINNWASGEAWHTGLAQAMIMGAIGGALGGGLGFAGGALAAGAAGAGARVVTQFAITVGADLVAEGLTQTIGYVAFGQEFNWQGFVMAGAMSGASFRAHPTAPRGGAPRAGVPTPPTPRAAGAAGGRRAAVTQVAGGAALGIAVEAVTAKVSGQKFDLSRAASAAASGAVGARTSRMGRGGTPGPEVSASPRRPTATPEPAGGPRPGLPEVDTPTAGRPRGDEPAVRPIDEPEAPRPRPAEETAPTRPREETPATRPPETEAPAAPRRTADVDNTTEGRRAQTEAAPATPHPNHPEVEPGVVARRKTLDGQDDIKVNRDGSVDICTDCARVRSRYATEINADPDLRRRMDEIEAIADPDVKASRCSELQAELSRLRETNLRPPTDASGAVDFDAWGTRIKASGVTGDVDAIVARAKQTGHDALAAQGELRAIERARLRGHDVEIVTPPTGMAAAPKSAEARLRRAGETGALEVKTATETPELSTVNARVDEAHRQVSATGGGGELSLDWTAVDISASRTLRGEFEIYRYLNGKMTNTQMRNFRYIEVVWRRPDGRIVVTSRSRNPNGTVNNVESSTL